MFDKTTDMPECAMTCTESLTSSHGIFPESTEQVMEKLKNDGRYPYDKIAIIAVAVIMPLVFGGSLGPEAVLVGVIAGLCCWIGDSLKRRGDNVAKIINVYTDLCQSPISNAPPTHTKILYHSVVLPLYHIISVPRRIIRKISHSINPATAPKISDIIPNKTTAVPFSSQNLHNQN